jgi:hypothetical protein
MHHAHTNRPVPVDFQMVGSMGITSAEASGALIQQVLTHPVSLPFRTGIPPACHQKHVEVMFYHSHMRYLTVTWVFVEPGVQLRPFSTVPC